MQEALNALTVLDILVKNCGYPFHIVIASKEFLNELVKRFPEKPAGGNMAQVRILELIQQWNATLCVTSRYRFPGVSGDAAAVMSAPETLKSEEELEEEDKIAQGAKLQELLRLGTPAALEQANELMKVMAGYDMQSRPDYRKQVNDELNKIETKIVLLNDLLNQRKNDTNLRNDSTVQELVGGVKSAQARIQKLISGGEDEERMERLLELNDMINTVLNNLESAQKGQTSF
ncbi:hypothetical protein HDU76_010846, partial [Blyttiomyces sp. JEL0837]